jgi:hypothetical protein
MSSRKTKKEFEIERKIVGSGLIDNMMQLALGLALEYNIPIDKILAIIGALSYSGLAGLGTYGIVKKATKK